MQGLMAYYSFDDGTAKDDSGNGNDGVVHGAAVVEGVKGKALYFDGVDDYVKIRDLVPYITNDWTLAAWVKAESFTDHREGIVGSGWDFHDWYLGVTGKRENKSFVVWVARGSEFLSPNTYSATCGPISAGQWYFIAGVREGKTLKLYVNGELKSVKTDTIWGKSEGYPFYIARTNAGLDWYEGERFNGVIDEVRVYNRALSDEEIRALYNEIAGYEGWKYRREIVIKENSGKTLTNYQILVEFNSSNFDFSKAKPDGSDIRFVDDEGHELAYWIEEWSSDEAKIWVKIPEIPAGDEAKIYMYYGNPNAESKSNGEAVFEFFDDFTEAGLNTSRWIIESHTSNWEYSVENGYLKLYTDGHVEWWESDCWTSPCREFFAIYIPYTENYLFETRILNSDLYSSDSSHVAIIGYDENNVYFWGPYHWTSFDWGKSKNRAEKIEDDHGGGVYAEAKTPFPMVFGIRRSGTTTYIYRDRGY